MKTSQFVIGTEYNINCNMFCSPNYPLWIQGTISISPLDNMPNVLWIWDLRSLKLVSLLVQCHSIKGIFFATFLQIPRGKSLPKKCTSSKDFWDFLEKCTRFYMKFTRKIWNCICFPVKNFTFAPLSTFCISIWWL